MVLFQVLPGYIGRGTRLLTYSCMLALRNSPTCVSAKRQMCNMHANHYCTVALKSSDAWTHKSTLYQRKTPHRWQALHCICVVE